MSVIATAVRHLMAAGVTGEALIAAIADMEAEQGAFVSNQPIRTSRQERNARHYQKKKQEASENRLKPTESVLKASETSESVLKEVSPCSPSSSPCTPNTIPYNPLPEKSSPAEKWPFGKVGKGEFEKFWATCPRKVGKQGAERAYLKARKLATAETVLEAMVKHRRDVSNTEEQFIPHPATWLNDGRFLDGQVSSSTQELASVPNNWPDWQREASKIIGEAQTTHWLANGKLEDGQLIVENKFKADWIRDNIIGDLEPVGIYSVGFIHQGSIKQ